MTDADKERVRYFIIRRTIECDIPEEEVLPTDVVIEDDDE